MPLDALIIAHREVQRAAKAVLVGLAADISVGATEASIAATQALSALGFSESWYYQCPAFVLSGSRSCESISGSDCVANSEPVGQLSLFTINLSPMQNGHWGDCARSFYVENGRVVEMPEAPELVVGKCFLQALHADMQATAHQDMTFHALHHWANARIQSSGFENLDFLGNVGHSIATHREDRQYIKAKNTRQLKEVPFIAFEPHVRQVGGK
jgi:hypothetical protein